MSDDEDQPAEPTKREGPRREAMWMAPTVGADTVAPAPRQPTPPVLSLSAFDPPAQRYAEQAELGRGGMGRVVEAVDRALGRAVAIKQSLATASTDLARFEREVRITARLQHPSVIPILDVGRDAEGRPFYIMRKIEGEPLADRVAAAATIRERVALVSELLGAIDAAAYAHARRIIHRDIKPWNILLGPFGETLLIDWGIARELDDDHPDPAAPDADDDQPLTRLGVAQGTPGFLAPEQARGEVVDARADVYSLGATLYFVLANQLPFGKIPATDAIARASAGTPPDFSVIPDEVPRELVAITTKAMAADRTARYADAGELAADLRRFLAGQLVAAHAYSTRERIARFVRRHRIAVTVAAVALLAVAVVSTLSIRQVVRDRDAAERARGLADDRADDALLQRARSLLDADPTSAIALLRELRRESPRWSSARELVVAAIRGGIERRLATHSAYVSGLRFSDDGKWLASGSKSLQLHEVPSGATRTLANDAVHKLTWWGPRTIAYVTERGSHTLVRTVDVETGATGDLDTTDPVDLIALGDRLAVRDAAGAVAVFARDRTKQVIAKGDIQLIAAGGEVLVAASPHALFVVDRNGTRELPIAAMPIMRLAVSPDGKRAALGSSRIVREWNLEELATEPRTLPRTSTMLFDLAYTGTALLEFSSNGVGFVSVSGNKPLWTTTERRGDILTRHILPIRGGAVLATDNGPYAILSAEGVARMPHRITNVTRVDAEATGRFVAFGLSDGSVLLDDLGFALPRLFRIAGAGDLAGVVDGKAVLTGFDHALSSDLPEIERGALDVRGLTLFEPESGQVWRREGRFVRDNVVVDGSTILTWDGTHHQLVNARGELLFELDSAQVMSTRGVVFWLARDGVWKRSYAPLGDAIKLAPLPAGLRLRPADPGRELVVALRVFDGEPVVSLADGVHTRSARITPTGLEDIPTPSGSHVLAGRLGGVWWTREAFDLERRLWRDAKVISLGHPVDQLRWLPDRVLAFGGGTLSELDGSGAILRQFALSAESMALGETTAYAPTAEGIVVLTPASSLLSTLRVPGKVSRVFASADGRRVFAMMSTDAGRRLAYWTDPVPDDPEALRRFLDTLTNARLSPSSYALTWD